MLRINFTGDGNIWTWGWGKFFLDYSFFLSTLLIRVGLEKSFSLATQANELLHCSVRLKSQPVFLYNM